ncbi:MAG: transglycosylase domain-containing protein [Myxococcales bacterium]|nr:transglycosylase domain-containing protein [Myxococcales bacterium]
MARSTRRWWLIPIVALSVVLIALGAAWPLVRARTQRTVEARCRAALGGECSIGALEMSRDGVRVHNIRAVAVGSTVRATVRQVDARFSWWDAVLSRPKTPLSISVAGVELGEDAPIADFVRELQRWRDARETRTDRADGASRFELVRFDLEQLSFSAQLAPFSRAELRGAAAHWTQGTAARVGWSNATVSLGPITAFQSGRCDVELPEDAGEGVVNCERFRARVDASSAMDQMRTAVGWMQLLQSLASQRPTSSASQVRDVIAGRRRFVPSQWRLRAREGVVELRRGESEIVTFSNTSAELEVRDRRVINASARLGSQQRGPALDLRVERPDAGASWVLAARGEDLPLAEVARWVRGVPWHDTERGRVRLDGRLRPLGEGRFEASGSCELRDFGLAHSKLSHDPVVGLTVGLDGSAQLDLAQRRISTERLGVAVNDVRAVVTGWAERAEDHTAVRASVSMARTSCDGVRRALPPSLTGPVAEITFGGEIAANVALELDTRRIDDTRLDVRVDDRCYVARDTYARGVARFSGPFVQRVQEPDRVRAFVTGPGTAAWVPIGDIAPHMINAVLSREDGRFYRHAGVDPSEIRNAIVRNVSAGRFVYGASTLSMQLAKNVFLAREKTLVRKLQELVLTWYLERSLGKDAILELYMNVVEFGPGVYGIGPASRFYFGVEPLHLTPLQAIFIATLLPNPVTRSGPFYRGSVGPGTMAMLRGHARIMNHRGLLSNEELAAAMVETLVFRPRRGPVNGVLTLEVDATLEDSVAVARAMAIPVPAQSAPREPVVDETGRAVVQNSATEDDSDDASERERTRDEEPAPMNDSDPRFVRVGVHRPTVRIR